MLRRHDPAPRRRRAARRGGLGLRPGRRSPRRRHHPELRGDRLRRSSGGRVTAVETSARPHRRRPDRHGGRRPFLACSPAMAGFALPLQSYTLQAMVSEPMKPCLDMSSPRPSPRRLCQPVRQGRAGDGRRARSLPVLCPARQFPDDADGGRRACSRCSRPSATLKLMRQWGGIVDIVAGQLADPRSVAGRGPVSQLRLGHGRLQGDPGRRHLARPHPRHRRASPDLGALRPFARFDTGALIDEAATPASRTRRRPCSSFPVPGAASGPRWSSAMPAMPA